MTMPQKGIVWITCKGPQHWDVESAVCYQDGSTSPGVIQGLCFVDQCAAVESVKEHFEDATFGMMNLHFHDYQTRWNIGDTDDMEIEVEFTPAGHLNIQMRSGPSRVSSKVDLLQIMNDICQG